MSVLLFAWIGLKLDADMLYWVVFWIYVIFRMFTYVEKADEKE